MSLIDTTLQPYTRQDFERAVLLSDLHSHSRQVALTLSHCADPSGYLPEGGVQDADSLALMTGLSGKQIRLSLSYLLRRGYLTRPSIHSWYADRHVQRGVRPITLTVPPPAARTQPPHTGGPGE